MSSFHRAVLSASAIAVAALTAGACSTTTQKPADLGAASSSAATGAGPTQDPAAASSPATPDSSVSTDAKPYGGAQSPDAALTGFLTSLIKGDYPTACKFLGQKGKDGAPPIPPSQQLCTQVLATPTSKTILTNLGKSFTPAGANKAATKVAVSGLTAATGPVIVQDTQVKVDGKSLHDIVAANEKGAKPAVTFQVTQIGKLWYVTDFGVQA